MQFIIKEARLLSLFLISCSFIVMGMILRSILISIPDLDLITNEEFKLIHKEYAINYSLGTAFLYAGFILFIPAIVISIIKFIKYKKDH